MLNNREISEQYEVQINTLYNWQKSKPKLYAYLKNADYNKRTHEEINELLVRYSKSIDRNFTVEEIHYFVASDTELRTIDEIETMHRIFIARESKNITKSRDLILSIYDKILALDIIEKYIFYKHVYAVRQKEGEVTDAIVAQYFDAFLDRS